MRWRWNGCPKAFQDFHDYFAPDFGRREAREHSRHYLQALLVQSEKRRNAENLSETVPASPTGVTAVSRRVSLGRRRSHRPVAGVSGFAIGGSPGGVGAGRQRFSQAGGEVGGSGQAVLRGVGQDSASCQAGVFLAHVGPRGRALVDKRLYLPEEWTGDGERCATAGVPADRRGYRSKTELALEMVEEAQARGYLKAQWVAGDSCLRDVSRVAGGDWRQRECCTSWTCGRI